MQVLMGDKIAASPYKLRMKTDVSCQQLCSPELSEARK